MHSRLAHSHRFFRSITCRINIFRVNTNSGGRYIRPILVANFKQKSITRLWRLLKAGKGSVGGVGGVSDEGGDEGANAGSSTIVAPNAGNNGDTSPSAMAACNKQAKSTFKSRADGVSSRGVQAALKLGVIASDLEAERAWAVDSTNPNGGMHEFRTSVFENKLDRLVRTCEDAHEEATAATEAYLLLLDKGR